MKKYNLLENAYDKLKSKLFDLEDADDCSDLIIEYKSIQGETIRFSWKDREERLREREKV